jgi:MraZ protein
MVQVSPDAHGRITLPKELVEYAGIESAAVVVGCFDYAEIWAQEAYDRMKAEEDVSALLSELESLGL